MYFYRNKINKNEQIILLEMCYCACFYNGSYTGHEFLISGRNFFRKVRDIAIPDFFYYLTRIEKAPNV